MSESDNQAEFELIGDILCEEEKDEESSSPEMRQSNNKNTSPNIKKSFKL
jgi:hypothetical protein